MTEELMSRIIAWGRDGLVLTALHCATMNQQAREVRLHRAISRVVSWLAELDFYGTSVSSRFDSESMEAIGRDRGSLDAAIISYLSRKGTDDKLLLAYDSVMAERLVETIERLKAV